MRPSRYAVPVSVCGMLVSVGGCAMNSADVLRGIDQVDARRGSGDLLQMVSSLGEREKLADRVHKQSEDVVTQAYMKAATPAIRRSVLGLAAARANGSGRYVPLFCYVLQFESDDKLRTSAARGFARMKSLTPVVSKSVIVILLGDTADATSNPQQQEWFVYYLEEFLLNVCDYRVPGAERIERPMVRADARRNTRFTYEVVRSDPGVILEWWRSDGREMAAAKSFDAM